MARSFIRGWKPRRLSRVLGKVREAPDAADKGQAPGKMAPVRRGEVNRDHLVAVDALDGYVVIYTVKVDADGNEWIIDIEEKQ